MGFIWERLISGSSFMVINSSMIPVVASLENPQPGCEQGNYCCRFHEKIGLDFIIKFKLFFIACKISHIIFFITKVDDRQVHQGSVAADLAL